MNSSAKVLVLGSGGQLGRAFACRLRSAEWVVHAFTHHELDISNPDIVAARLDEIRPTWVINCAAMTHVEACEKEPALAHQVNASAVEGLARHCAESNVRLVQVSTDYVFDGLTDRPYREEDPTQPLNAYARSKLASEQAARSCANHLIVRTAWLYAPGGRNFLSAILTRASAGQCLRVVDDQIGCPSYAPDIADGIVRLMAAEAEGTFHVVNAGQTSWFGLAQAALEFARIEAEMIPVSSSEYGGPVVRPAYSVLDCGKYIAATAHRLRPWKDALKEYMQRRG